MAINADKMYKSIETGQLLKGEYLQMLCDNACKAGREDLEAELLLTFMPAEEFKEKEVKDDGYTNDR